MEKIHFIGKSKFLKQEDRRCYRDLINLLATRHNFVIESLNYVFLTDEELLEINRQSLNHDTYTDIITFDLSDSEGMIDGEIYISKDRINENAMTYKVTFEEELTRVISHGVLHLMGYKDKEEVDIQKMRNAENESIKLWKDMFHMKPNKK